MDFIHPTIGVPQNPSWTADAGKTPLGPQSTEGPITDLCVDPRLSPSASLATRIESNKAAGT